MTDNHMYKYTDRDFLEPIREALRKGEPAIKTPTGHGAGGMKDGWKTTYSAIIASKKYLTTSGIREARATVHRSQSCAKLAFDFQWNDQNILADVVADIPFDTPADLRRSITAEAIDKVDQAIKASGALWQAAQSPALEILTPAKSTNPGDLDIRGITVIDGPAGSRGFRSGLWTVERDGSRYQVYDSVPHSCHFDDQDRRVKLTAAAALAARDAAAKS